MIKDQKNILEDKHYPSPLCPLKSQMVGPLICFDKGLVIIIAVGVGGKMNGDWGGGVMPEKIVLAKS